MCVNSQSGSLRVEKARKKTKSNLFFISIATQCLVRIEYVKASTSKSQNLSKEKTGNLLPSVILRKQEAFVCQTNTLRLYSGVISQSLYS